MKKGRKKVSLIILGITALLVVILVILCNINPSTSLIESLKAIIVCVIGGILVWLIIPDGKKDETTPDANSDDSQKQPVEEGTSTNNSKSKSQRVNIIIIIYLTMVAIIIAPINFVWSKSTPNPSITVEMTPSPAPTPSLAEMLEWSNKGYNDVQKLKDSRTTESLDKYAIAHRNSGKIRQIDVVATTSQSEYLPYPHQSAIYYYTADGELCFILLHNAGTKNDDLRFYVYDDTVIQFIDVDGTTSYSAPEEYSDICERGMSIYHTACDFLGVK